MVYCGKVRKTSSRGFSSLGQKFSRTHCLQKTREIVPWSKHIPAVHRLNFTAQWRLDLTEHLDRDSILPVVTIRDPYSWMSAMCRHHYSAYFRREKNHCPMLVLDSEKTNEVTVRYDPKVLYKFESLAHFWQEWNEQYLNAKYPRLMVRFEDIIYHTKETVTKIKKSKIAAIKNH